MAADLTAPLNNDREAVNWIPPAASRPRLRPISDARERSVNTRCIVFAIPARQLGAGESQLIRLQKLAAAAACTALRSHRFSHHTNPIEIRQTAQFQPARIDAVIPRLRRQLALLRDDCLVRRAPPVHGASACVDARDDLRRAHVFTSRPNCEKELLGHDEGRLESAGKNRADPARLRILESFSYNDLVTWGSSDEKFIIVIGNVIQQRKIILKTKEGAAMNSLCHELVRCKVRQFNEKLIESDA